jgi:4,5-DOPA dioxygenase extradiol
MSTAAKSPNATESAVALVKHPLFRKAHPTPEHYLPFVVAAAAAGHGAKCQEIFTMPDGALGWGSWRWD